MKKFISISTIVVLLLATAMYYGSLNKTTSPPAPTPTPQPVVNTPVPVPQEAKPVTSLSSAGTLTLTSAISQGYMLKGQTNEMYATVDIKAIAHKGLKRPPLNVALVIDRSGSMNGDKIQYAKQAARRLVGMLDSQDRVAIVSYGSDVDVNFGSRPVNAMNREQMLNAIDRIEVSGGTNLSGGFERGLREVQSWNNSQAINRVLLMSDGNANIGVTYLPELRKMSSKALSGGVSLSTIGVGLDYNEDLMTAMANEGAGNYYFVDNATSIAQSFEQELKGLSSSVAKDSALVIKLAPGVSLGELYGFPYRQQGDSIMIPLDAFYSEQSKNVLLKLNVPADAVDSRQVMDVQLSYTDLVNKNATKQQNVALSSVVTTDQNKASTSIDRNVIARVQQVEVATSMNKAMDMYSEGNAQEAVQLMKRQQSKMRRARKKYDLKGSDFDRVDNEINTMNADMVQNAPSSASGRKMVKSKKARSNYIVFDSAKF